MQTNRPANRHYLFAYLILIILAACSPDAFALDVGDQAPDFTLPSTLGDSISMHQFKGRKYVLIEFYSLDFNPT